MYAGFFVLGPLKPLYAWLWVTLSALEYEKLDTG